ncbi:MAG TPA: succinyl-diaminopimelate desuccinylase [Marmoricola sp.]
MTLDLTQDVVALTAALVDIESVSTNEQAIADAVEAELRRLPHLTTVRHGNTIVARTDLGAGERVVIAGHLDTVPVEGNLPSHNDGEVLHGRGTVDMKGGVAVALKMAHDVAAPVRDVTYVFYECEEIDAARNGLRVLSEEHPDLITGDFAILMEPSDGVVEAGCQGTLRFEVVLKGEAAHSARAWRGDNAIHKAAGVLARLNAYVPRKPVIDGLEYHEGLNAVLISGGTATNVIPAECRVQINFRYAPDRSEDEALAYVREFFADYDLEVTDSAPGALPGLDRPAAKAFVAAVGGEAKPKFGWTDVARFTVLGVPAVNYGPGDPMLAHKADEHVPVAQLVDTERTLGEWLRGER